MKDIVRDTDQDWRLLGDGDPYWAVCTDEAYRAGAMTAEARERFFESGSSYVDTNHSLLKRHFDAPDRFGSVLDFGCGVGRLLIPWSRIADRAVGVDVSPGMLALSASNAAEAGRENVQTAASLDEAAPQGPFDLVNTYIVLQHIHPERGMVLIERLAAMVAEGGFLICHVTAYRDAHLSDRVSWKRRLLSTLIGLYPKISAGRITMYDYDLAAVMSVLNRAGFGAVHMTHENHGGHHGFVIRSAKTQRTA